jgi:hypothetical protein
MPAANQVGLELGEVNGAAAPQIRVANTRALALSPMLLPPARSTPRRPP